MDPRPTHSFEVIYRSSLLRDAVRTYVLRRFVLEQRRLWLLSGLMLGMAVWFGFKGQPPWAVALAASGALMAPVLTAVGWWVHLSNTLDALKRMGTPRAAIALREDAMEIASEAGKGELPWSTLTEVWERPDYWMFFTGPNRFNILPKGGMSEAAQAYFRERNGRIVKRV